MCIVVSGFLVICYISFFAVGWEQNILHQHAQHRVFSDTLSEIIYH